MLPDGSIFARRVHGRTITGPVDRIVIVGDVVKSASLVGSGAHRSDDGFDVRHRQAFGDRTTDILAGMSIGVVGASGTGSPIVEMLARLGVRRIVLIEPDIVEMKNLNRIWGSRHSDAAAGVGKGVMLKAHIEAIGLGTDVELIEDRVETPEAISLLSTTDFVFGCVDSVEGRDALNRIATFYILPYIDVGVRLDADGDGGIASVSAGVHYITPGGSSLRTRGVYTDAELHAEHLRRTDPEFYDDQVRRGYIRGVEVDRPAVISINAAVAAAAVNEMLARLHPFRSRPNGEFAIQKLLFTHGRIVTKPDGPPDETLARHIGRGDASPVLLSPRFGRKP